jgi:hypothetical protein
MSSPRDHRAGVLRRISADTRTLITGVDRRAGWTARAARGVRTVIMGLAW